jgi:hypothetical protein
MTQEIVLPKDNVDCMAMPGIRAEVLWRPGDTGFVQLATTNQHSTFTLDPEPETVTQSSITPTPLAGWHVTLDREGINRLIRSLRKARDSVYGRDE